MRALASLVLLALAVQGSAGLAAAETSAPDTSCVIVVANARPSDPAGHPTEQAVRNLYNSTTRPSTEEQLTWFLLRYAIASVGGDPTVLDGPQARLGETREAAYEHVGKPVAYLAGEQSDDAIECAYRVSVEARTLALHYVVWPLNTFVWDDERADCLVGGVSGCGADAARCLASPGTTLDADRCAPPDDGPPCDAPEGCLPPEPGGEPRPVYQAEQDPLTDAFRLHGRAPRDVAAVAEAWKGEVEG